MHKYRVEVLKDETWEIYGLFYNFTLLQLRQAYKMFSEMQTREHPLRFVENKDGKDIVLAELKQKR